MKHKYKNLMSPLKIGSITIKNRYAMGALGGRYFLFGEKGAYTKNGIDYYVERARGGFGLIVTGSNVADLTVDPFDPVNGNPNPAYAPGVFKHGALTLTERVHAYGSKIFMQISMGPGRMRDGKSCSPIPRLKAPDQLTEELTPEEIEHKIAAMAKLAKLAKGWGYDGVEVHGMHWGYLLDQFAMAYTNHRTDEYGGDLEGRLTVARKIVRAIKEACGQDFPVSIRLCMKTYMAGYNKASLTGEDEVGRTIEECVEIAKLFESYGYDMLNCNSGTYDAFYYCVSPYYMPKCYNIHLAKELKKAVSIPVFVAGAMDDPDTCEQAIANGLIDGVTLARPALADSAYPQKVTKGDLADIRPCIKCANCMESNGAKGVPQCSVNPIAMNERNYGIRPAAVKKKIMVVGGGVAGMEAARTAALSGHVVSLYEKTDRLGGHLIEAGAHPFKSDIAALNAWYQNQLRKLKVDIHLNAPVSPDFIKLQQPDAVIMAMGSHHFIPGIPGKDHPKAVSCYDALLGNKRLGEKVVVVGGGLTGCELAYQLAKFEGKKVTIVEGLEAILAGKATIPLPVKMMLSQLIQDCGVAIETSQMIREVNDQGAVIQGQDGKTKTIDADQVIFAIGLKPVQSMAEELYGSGIDVYEVGDHASIGNIRTATAAAFEIARNL